MQISKIVDCKIADGSTQAQIEAAMRDLSGVGFKLYMYLVDMAWLEGGRAVFQISGKDVCDTTGMTMSSYQRSVKELEEMNYIRPRKGRKRYYNFDGTNGLGLPNKEFEGRSEAEGVFVEGGNVL